MKWNKTGHHTGLSSPKREEAMLLLRTKLRKYKTTADLADILISESTSCSSIKYQNFKATNRDIIDIEDFVEYLKINYPEYML